MNIKVITLFSGYDSQCMALDRLHSNFSKFNYELVGWSEINKYAIQAHNAIYPQWENRNLGDVCKIDWAHVSDFDLLTYSSPCQDFSQAGHQKGGKKGSGTRSSLLWECERAIKAKRPKYLLMENVSALVSKKFIKLFNKWQSTLESYGYTNYAKVLNAKDFEVPQNRERIFMVSVRNDVADRFYFPQPYKLEKRLKDVLEEKVDEKYYLSEKAIKGFLEHNAHHIKKGTGFLFISKTKNDIASCIRSNSSLAATDNTIIKPIVIPVGNVNPSGNGMNGNVFSSDGISPTLTTNKGEGYKILEPDFMGISINPISRKLEFKGINSIKKDAAPTLRATDYKGPACLWNNSRIRKLTPKEYFRLMDASEENINQLLDSGISNSQLYKLAGNSIVVNCLYHIFRKLFAEKQNEDIQLTFF